jgi:dethiobiotin synthetase
MSAWFITGTDTGVGKSRFSVALLHALARDGQRCVGMKPIAAGAEADADGVLQNEDVVALRAAGNVQVPALLDNPYLLREPVSPHIAAAREGVAIDVQLLRERFLQLQRHADAVVVEGAGGFCVPLSPTATGADLAQALQLPVILVVGLRLGCLSHALLTKEAIAARGLRLAGWVANVVDPQMLQPQANLDYLAAQLQAPMLAHWPWAPDAKPDRLTLTLPDA